MHRASQVCGRVAAAHPGHSIPGWCPLIVEPDSAGGAEGSKAPQVQYIGGEEGQHRASHPEVVDRPRIARRHASYPCTDRQRPRLFRALCCPQPSPSLRARQAHCRAPAAHMNLHAQPRPRGAAGVCHPAWRSSGAARGAITNKQGRPVPCCWRRRPQAPCEHQDPWHDQPW